MTALSSLVALAFTAALADSSACLGATGEGQCESPDADSAVALQIGQVGAHDVSTKMRSCEGVTVEDFAGKSVHITQLSTYHGIATYTYDITIGVGIDQQTSDAGHFFIGRHMWYSGMTEHFEYGDMCPGNVARSATITYSFGPELKLLRASEPTMCNYVYDVQLPESECPSPTASPTPRPTASPTPSPTLSPTPSPTLACEACEADCGCAGTDGFCTSEPWGNAGEGYFYCKGTMAKCGGECPMPPTPAPEPCPSYVLAHAETKCFTFGCHKPREECMAAQSADECYQKATESGSSYFSYSSERHGGTCVLSDSCDHGVTNPVYDWNAYKVLPC